MTLDAISGRLDGLTKSVEEICRLQREANGRLGKLEGRVYDTEIWRARMQGVAATSRVVWIIAGGAVTAGIIELVRAMGVS